jgi:RNA-directed DNA polymerase
MGRTALHSVAEKSRLLKSWKRINSRATGPKRLVSGIDKVTVEDFKSESDRRLEKIERDLRKNHYHFSNLLAFTIPKENGDYRIINIPTVEDRVVQAALLDFLSEKSIFKSKSNYGFLKGKTVKKALQKLVELRANSPFVVKFDVEAFFDTIPRAELMKRVQRKIRFSSIRDLILSVIQCESEFRSDSDLKKAEAKGLKGGKGIRQGMPLSPFLANLYLDQLDTFVEGKGYALVRYADDFVVLCSSSNEADQAKRDVILCLDRLGLSVSESKTKTFLPEESVEFLGIDCSLSSDSKYHLELSNKKIRKLNSNISDYRDINFCLKNGVHLFNLEKQLDSMMLGYLQAYDVCQNCQSIKDRLTSTKSKTIRSLIENGIGIKINDLDFNQLKFLGMNNY